MQVKQRTPIRSVAVLAGALALAGGAGAAEITREELKKALEANPDLVLDVLRKDGRALFEIVSRASQEENQRRQQEAQKREQAEYEEAFKNPKTAVIDERSHVRGNPKAPLTLVIYTDFQCPYCSRANKTVETLREKYKDDLRIVLKEMPLPMHPEAMPAAQWMEAVALQSKEKAWKFHDTLFANQDKLGAAYYKEVAAGLQIDVAKAEEATKSEDVKQRIAADLAEAQKFGFSGTPGFLLNGVPIRGAYPIDHFEKIIARLKSPQAPGAAAPPKAPSAP
jgi:protein-disulfide isomerase